MFLSYVRVVTNVIPFIGKLLLDLVYSVLFQRVIHTHYASMYVCVCMYVMCILLSQTYAHRVLCKFKHVHEIYKSIHVILLCACLYVYVCMVYKTHTCS